MWSSGGKHRYRSKTEEWQKEAEGWDPVAYQQVNEGDRKGIAGRCQEFWMNTLKRKSKLGVNKRKN